MAPVKSSHSIPIQPQPASDVSHELLLRSHVRVPLPLLVQRPRQARARIGYQRSLQENSLGPGIVLHYGHNAAVLVYLFAPHWY